jgi:predicted Zn finger-like uncharacterized protein
MAFAARCPACATLFRVVPDQLKLADGWVRCGRCEALFHAGDALIDLDRAETPAAEPKAPAAAPAADETPAALGPAAEVPAPLAEEPTDASAAPEPAAALPELDLRADAPPIAATPSFLRRDERAARWQQPRWRRALALGSLAAALLLALQVLVHFRDMAAAQGPPGLRVIVEGLCNIGGCRIETPRRLDSLVLDNSALAAAEGSSAYRLSLVLRNRAAVDVMMPALDLALTDAEGRLIARRVLRVAELGAPQPTLPAGGTLPLRALLDIGETPVAGYTIEAFYP